jgi:hypothetical protein
MRSMAGFSPSIQGNFYLPRAKTLPPQSLEQAVWPFVDEWLTWFDSYANSGEDEDGHVKNESHVRAYENEDEVDRRDLAAQGFLRLLKQLPIILLQDSVIMRQEFPLTRSGPIPFLDGTIIRRSRKTSRSPRRYRLERRCRPLPNGSASSIKASLATSTSGAYRKERLDNIESRLGDLFEGRISMTLSSTRHVAGLFHARLDNDGHVVSLPTDLSAKPRLAVPASNRRRRRTCSPVRSRPSRSCGGSGQWV